MPELIMELSTLSIEDKKSRLIAAFFLSKFIFVTYPQLHYFLFPSERSHVLFLLFFYR